MKKAKVFLTATAIVAIVGSALAFKAHYSTDFCYAPVPPNGSCANVIATLEQPAGDLNGATPFCYAIKTTTCTNVAVPNKGNVEAEPGN